MNYKTLGRIQSASCSDTVISVTVGKQFEFSGLQKKSESFVIDSRDKNDRKVVLSRFLALERRHALCLPRVASICQCKMALVIH